MPSELVLVLGGTRSGKSAVAEAMAADLAARHGLGVSYLATATVDAADRDMAARIARHRMRRPAAWATVEVGATGGLPEALASVDGVVLVDSLGAWLAAVGIPAGEVATGALVGALAARPAPSVVVSEEVGLSVHPATELGRRFADDLGTLNQAVAAVASRAVLVVAGLVLELTPWPDAAC